MDAHGYVIAGNAKTAKTDFIPSLIGVDQAQLNPTFRDVYFERIDLPDRRVGSLTVTRWVSYDSLPNDHRDPILGVKRPDGKSYYIPYSELYEIASFNHDDDTIEMLEALNSQRRSA